MFCWTRSDAAQARRAELVRVLEQIRDPEAVKPLVDVLDDADEELAGAAVEALVAFGQTSVGPLLDQLESPSELMRARVSETLRRLGDVVRSALVEIAATAEPSRAAAALGVVRGMGATEVLPALVARITGRYTCRDCGEVYHDVTRPTKVAGTCDSCGSTVLNRRADDNEDALKQRLMEYYKKTSPLIGYYYAKHQLSSVDGLAEMDAVAAAVAKVLDRGQ